MYISELTEANCSHSSLVLIRKFTLGMAIPLLME